MKYFLLILFLAMNVNAVCLKAGDEVKLTGILKEKLAYGPLGWGEDEETDEKITYWVLELSKPLNCVDDVDTRREEWNKTVELILEPIQYKENETSLNKKMDVIGKVFIADNGYHMTPVLLSDISSLTLSIQK